MLAACLLPRRPLFAGNAPLPLCHPHSQNHNISIQNRTKIVPFCIFFTPLPAPKKIETTAASRSCSILSLHQNMRIRNSVTLPQRSLSPPPDLLSSSILQPPPSPPPSKPSIFSPTKAMMMTTIPPSSSPSDQQPPHVMVSRINARLSSNIDNGADSKGTFFKTSRLIAQNDETTTGDSWCVSTYESLGHSIYGQTSTSSSVSSSLSYNGRWCEEERAIPLKKRRVVIVSNETNQSKEITKKGALEERKRSMGETERCNRGNGKGWRCNKTRVKGHSLCKHHLELQRMRNINCPRRSNQGERGSFAGRANQIGENNRVPVVKARSMSSLLRDTVPLLYY